MLNLIPYFSVDNLSVMSGQVFLGSTSTKQGLICLAQGNNSDAGDLETNSLPLSHWAPLNLTLGLQIINNSKFNSEMAFNRQTEKQI